MGHLQRYVVADTLKVFGVTMAGSVLLLTFGGGAKEGVRHGLPPYLVVQLMPFIVLEMLRFTVPGCLLFACCSVFGRLTASNELTALKSVGIHPLRIIWPVMVAAYLLSIGTFQLYDVSASWARPNLQRLLVESVAEVAYGVLKTDRSFSSEELSIVVKGVEGRRLLQPVITVPASNDGHEMTLAAREAELRYNEQGGTLQMICYNARVDIGGKWSLDFPDRFVQDVPLGGSQAQTENRLSPAALARRFIPRQIQYEEEVLESLRQEGQKLRGRELSANNDNMNFHRTRLYRLRAETQRRLANGFACFCFALVGIPVAIWWRSADNVSSFFVCFLPILLVYYPLLVVGETIARKGILPEVSVWLADAVLILASLILFRRVLRQ